MKTKLGVGWHVPSSRLSTQRSVTTTVATEEQFYSIKGQFAGVRAAMIEPGLEGSKY